MNDPNLERRLRRDLQVVAGRIDPVDRFAELSGGRPDDRRSGRAGHRRPAARLLAAAAVVVVLVGGLLAVGRDPAGLDVTTGPEGVDAWCTIASTEVFPGVTGLEILTAPRDWREWEIFLNSWVTAAEAEALAAYLELDPMIASIRFVSQAEKLEQFQRIWHDRPHKLDGVEEGDFPLSYHVRLDASADDARAVEAALSRWGTLPAVREAVPLRSGHDLSGHGTRMHRERSNPVTRTFLLFHGGPRPPAFPEQKWTAWEATLDRLVATRPAELDSPVDELAAFHRQLGDALSEGDDFWQALDDLEESWEEDPVLSDPSVVGAAQVVYDHAAGTCGTDSG